MNEQEQIPDYAYMERYMKVIMKKVYLEKFDEYMRKIDWIIERIKELDEEVTE